MFRDEIGTEFGLQAENNNTAPAKSRGGIKLLEIGYMLCINQFVMVMCISYNKICIYSLIFKNIMMEQEQTSYEETTVEETGMFRRTFVLSGDTYLLVAKWSLYMLAFLSPIFFLPFTAAPLFAKEALVLVLLGIALVGWLAHFLATGRIAYKKSWLNGVLLGLLVVTVISAFRSQSFFVSLWGPDVTGEKLLSLAVFVVAYFLTSVLLDKEEVTKVLGWVYGSLLLAGIFSLLQLFHAYVFPFDFARRVDFNTIGTINALAVFYGFFFVVGLGLLIHMRQVVAEVPWKKLFKWTILLSTFILLVNILLISMPRVTAIGGFTILSNFQAVWFGIGLAMMVFLGQSFRNVYRSRSDGGDRVSAHFGMAYYLPLVVLIFSALFYFVQTPFLGGILGDVPVEVTPTLSTTLTIGKDVVKANPFFGSGPGTFGFDYNRYHSADINQTPFWSVKFFHGFSFISTIFATTGVVGFLAWLVFLGIVLFILFRTLFGGAGFDPVKFSIFGGVCFSFLLMFLYASNFTTLLFVFILLGLFAARSVEDSGKESGFVFAPRTLSVVSPAFMFISSLVAIFLVVLSVVGIYFTAQKYVAESYYNSGVKIFNATGSADNAEVKFARALAIDAQSDNYIRAEGQMRLIKMQLVVNRALQGEQNVQVEFQSSFSAARDAMIAATKVNPREPQNWTLLGVLYENLIPFIAGADQLAVSSYREAINQDPMNPAVFLDLGRTLLESVDSLQARLGQASGKEASRLSDQRADYLNQAEEVLGKAASLKSDYAPAHFLLAQTYTRKNNLDLAVRKTEDTKALSPFDVGVAFQLGFLYYQAGALDKAQAEFERAVSLNANYSNARYFLGLIYDRHGNKAQALDQFQKIAALNPDNQEVKKIIQNLQLGNSALFGIVPPAPAPEKRGTAPVGETRSNVVTPK